MKADSRSPANMDDFAGALFSLLKETPTTSSALLRGYKTFLDLCESTDRDELDRKLCEEMVLLCKCLQRDIAHADEEISSSALKVLGFVWDRTSFTKSLPDEEATKFLLILLALTTSSNNKQVCRLGLWCLSMQKLKPSVLVPHVKLIINVVVHGIDNPLGSLTIIVEAFQVLLRLTKILPTEMRGLSWIWAPPVCLKLLYSNSKIAENAQSSLSEMEHILVPPVPRLSEVLLEEIQQRLRTSLEDMIKLDERSVCMAVKAWGWLVKLLGSSFVQEKSVTNVMLQLLETSFTNHSPQARSACQVAWVSVVDAFVPSTVVPSVHGSPETLAKPSTAARLKYLNLLLVPLLEVMKCEKHTIVQQNCCRTWIYLLCKLGPMINDKEVFDAAVTRMLHLVFSRCHLDVDQTVWETCVDILGDAISCKGSEENNFDEQSKRSMKTSIHSPKTPVSIDYTGVFSDSHHKNIRWRSFHLGRLGSLLRLLDALWKAGLEQPNSLEKTTEGQRGCSLGRHFEVVRECWSLLVRGVEAEGRNLIRPPCEHISAVHMLLDFMSAMFVVDKHTDELLSFAWTLAEILIDGLGIAIVASSYYRKRVHFASPMNFAEDDLGERDAHQLPNPLVPDTVTPVVYIAASWLKLLFGASSENREHSWMRPIEKVVAIRRVCFDVMGHYQGFAAILNNLAKSSCLYQIDKVGNPAGSSSKAEVVKASNFHFLLSVWRALANDSKEQLSKANEVPAVGGLHRDSGYDVVLTILLFPIEWTLTFSSHDYRVSQEDPFHLHHLETLIEQIEVLWLELFDVVLRISSLKCSQQNSLISGLFNRISRVLKWNDLQNASHQLSSTNNGSRGDFTTAVGPRHFLRFLVDIFAHAVKHTDIWSPAMLAISRKRRKTGFGASSKRVHCVGGMELEDANNLKDLFSVGGMLLILLRNQYMQRKTDVLHDPILRLLRALTDLMQQVTSQCDSILLLQSLADPFVAWLAIGCDGKGGQRGTQLPDSLLETLARSWDGFLSCLENCRPYPVFESNLLLAQAPCLAAAFVHHRGTIANRTLAFWERTYAVKSSSLKYPPSLVKVFDSLRQKVDISLPGWSSQAGTAPETSHEAPRVLNSREVSLKRQLKRAGRQLEGRIRSMMNAASSKRAALQEEHPVTSASSRETKLGSSEAFAAGNIERQVNQADSYDLLSHTPSMKMPSAEHQECSVNKASIEVPDFEGQFMPTPEGNAVIDALVNTYCTTASNVVSEDTPRDDVPNSSCSDVQLVVDLGPARDDGKVNMDSAHDKVDSISLAAECPSMSKDGDQLKVSTEPAHEGHPNFRINIFPSVHDGNMPVEGAQHGNQTDNQAVTNVAGGITPTLVTPPVASSDIPSIPPKIPLPADRLQGAERPHGATDATTKFSPVAAGESSKGSGAGTSGRPRRRKMLNFQDNCGDLKDVISPHNQAKRGILTNRRKNGRCSHANRTQVVENFMACDVNEGVGAEGRASAHRQVSNDGNFKENVPPEISQFPDSTSQAGKVTRRRSSRIQHKGSTVEDNETSSSKFVDKEEYVKLKDRLLILMQSDPTLTFRQISVQEQYSCLPRYIQKRLSSICCKYRRRCVDLDKSYSERLQDSISKLAESREVQDPGKESRFSVSAAEVIPRRTPSSRALKRKSGPQRQKVVNVHPLILRSGKLCGRQRWKMNSVSGSVITARLGFKKILAKKQRICSSNPELEMYNATSEGLDNNGAISSAFNCSVKSCGVRTRSCDRKATLGTSLGEVNQESKISPPSKLQDSSLLASKGDPMQQANPPQASSSFQVRTLNRGWLANAYSGVAAAFRGSDESCGQAVESKQTSVSSRAIDYNSRKGRMPKRAPSWTSSAEFDNVHRVLPTTPVARSSNEKSPENGEVPPPFSGNDINNNTIFNAGAEPSPSVAFTNLGLTGKEDLSLRSISETGADDREEQNIRSCFLENSEQPSSSATLRVPSAAVQNGDDTVARVGPVAKDNSYMESESNNREKDSDAKASGSECYRHTSQRSPMGLAGGPVTLGEYGDYSEGQGKQVQRHQEQTSQAESMLRILVGRSDVRVSQVLVALLGSSKWEIMEAAETARAKKLLDELMETIPSFPGRPPSRGGFNEFITPT